MTGILRKASSLAMVAAMSIAIIAPSGATVAKNKDTSKFQPLATTNTLETDRIKPASQQALTRAETGSKTTVTIGTVINISSDSITILGRKQNDSNSRPFRRFTYRLDSSTLVLRKIFGLGSLDEVGLGDRVQVWVTKDGHTLVIWDKSVWLTEVNGTVASIDPLNRSFVLLVMVNGMTHITTVNTMDATIFRMNGSAAAFADLAVDEHVAVFGLWHDVTKDIDAETVTISPAVTVPPTEAVVATIDSPATPASFTSGQPVNFAGTCTNGLAQPISGCLFSWQADFINHGTIAVKYGPTAPSASMMSGSFLPSLTPADGTDGFFRLFLTVESNGVVRTVSRDITPVTSVLSFASVPTGLQLTVDGTAHAAPFDMTAVAGTTHTVSAPTPQTINGTTYNLVSWSDAGAATHNIVAPSVNTTYTASFSSVPATSVLSFASVPAGLEIMVDGVVHTAPFSMTAVVGSTHSISASTPQTISGTTFTLVSWSDGGAASHNIVTPAVNTSYTATFTTSTSATLGPTATTNI